jgi:ABC-type branched-subunit amino acid transport system substrate-binding protein
MVFRNFLTPSQEVRRLLDKAIGEKGIRRFAVLYPDNPYGHFFADLFRSRAEQRGASITATEIYHTHQTDFTDQIKKLTGRGKRKFRPVVGATRKRGIQADRKHEQGNEEFGPAIDLEALFIPDTFQRVAMITPQLSYHEIGDVLLMGTSLWQSPKLVELAGDYVQGAIFPSGFFEWSDAQGVEAFVADYRNRYNVSPGILAAIGYDTIRLLGEVLRREGILTRENVQAGLVQSNGFGGVTGTISFDSQGEVERAPFLLTVSGNEIVLDR